MDAAVKPMTLPILNFVISPNLAALVIESLSIMALIVLGGDANNDVNSLRDTVQIIGWITVMVASIVGTILAGWFLYRSKSNKYLKEDRDNLAHLLESTKLVLTEYELQIERLTNRKNELKTELDEERSEKLRLKGELKFNKG